MDEAFELQLKRNIEISIADGRLGDAFEECTKILDKSPGNPLFVNLKRTIEAKMFELNKEKIKAGVQEAEKLFKEKNTVGALQKIRELLTLAPNDSSLIRLHGKFQERYKEEADKSEKQFIHTKEEVLKKLLDTDSYSILLQEIDELESSYMGNKDVMSLAARTREALIQKEIANKKDLLSSGKFEEIFDFIDDLKNIKKDSKALLDLEAIMKKHQAGSAMRTIGDFVYSGVNDLDTLMKLKKYNEAVQVSEELLEVNPGDEKIRTIYKNAKRKAFAMSKNEAVAVIEKSLPALKEEYKTNKDNFVTL